MTREAHILAVADWYLGGLSGEPAPSPEAVRDSYLRAAGYKALAAMDTLTEAEIDFTDESALTIIIRIRDRATLNRVAKFVRLPFTIDHHPGVTAIHGGGAPANAFGSWDALAHARLREPGSVDSRGQRLEGPRVATVLAVFYLSNAGGGTRTIADSIDLLQDRIADPALESYMEGWPRTYSRILTTLRARYGPLTDKDT